MQDISVLERRPVTPEVAGPWVIGTALDGWEDEQLLALATDEGRVIVTFNVGDFARITTEWAAAGRSHAGCLLIVGIDDSEFGIILRVIEHAFSTRPDHDSWIGITAWGTRSATP